MRLLVWSMGAVALIGFSAHRASLDKPRPSTPVVEEVDLDAAADVADASNADASTGRPVYRYSVIPGGAYDAKELAGAIERDPIVAVEYRAIAEKGIHAEVVPADRMAYMSYRIANKIYWTKHRIKLRKGETVLTNGEAMLRGRCGNGISLDPMEPTADAEPAPMELEALAPGVPALLDGRRLPFDLVLQNGFTPGLNAVDNLGVFQGMAPLFSGGGLSGIAGTPSTPVTEIPPVDFPPTFPIPPGLPGTPPGHDQIIHQIIDIATGPPTLDGPPDDGPKFPPGGPDTPTDPVPTPEPTTLLLVGGGLAGIVMRRRKSNNQTD